MQFKITKRKQRHKRIRSKINGIKECPRLCVFRSNKHVYAQLIDDTEGKTLVSSNDFNLKKKTGGKTDQAKLVGKDLAQKASEKKIKEVVFDRGGYNYHGRVKALAEGAREGGLKF